MKNKSIKPISVNNYIFEHDAAVCPLCLSEDISSGPCEMDGSFGTALVQCASCGSYWTDMWKVTGYVDLNEHISPEDLEAVMKKAEKIKLSLTE